MILRSLFAAALLTLPLLAADKAEVWKASDLRAAEKGLREKTRTTAMGDYGNHNITVNLREQDGMVEVHNDWNDIFYVVSGEATLVLGGTPVDLKQTAPGEFRGPRSTGGEEKVLGPGDVVHIPAKVPHWFKVAKGKQITYVTTKVPAAQNR